MKISPIKIEAGCGAGLFGSLVFDLLAGVFFPEHRLFADCVGTVVGVGFYIGSHFIKHHHT